MTLMRPQGVDKLPSRSPRTLDERGARAACASAAFPLAFPGLHSISLMPSFGSAICLPPVTCGSAIRRQDIVGVPSRSQVNSASRATLARGAWSERFAWTYGRTNSSRRLSVARLRHETE